MPTVTKFESDESDHEKRVEKKKKKKHDRKSREDESLNSSKHSADEKVDSEERTEKEHKRAKRNKDKKERRDRSRSRSRSRSRERHEDRRDRESHKRKDDRSGANHWRDQDRRDDKRNRHEAERGDRRDRERDNRQERNDWRFERHGRGEKPWERDQKQIAEQRKLLWANKKNENPQETVGATSTSATVAAQPKNAGLWSSAIAATGVGGQQANKFLKLMGIKNTTSLTEETVDQKKLRQEREKQERMLSDLDKQYATARETTHMGRGLGLGFR